ncbi:DUF3037 domain-containing protein [Limibacter armeniacum]|uniref:DUF3037 domain-containing protein n=1 Tax=Limibacter armeniacum TaxID=466084 RepID=UPI002FE570DC
MQEKQLYEYAFIRFVPKVERGEFINVGVIIYCKFKKYIGVKYHIDEKRLEAFSDRTDAGVLEAYLKTWELICNGGKDGGNIAQLDMPSRFRWLTATRSTIIQSSEVHTGLCTEPEAVLEKLFEEYVL